MEEFLHITERFEETKRNYSTICESTAFCSILLPRWVNLLAPEEVLIMEFNIYSTPALVFAIWVVH